MTWTLHEGDCPNVLRTLPDGCVSHIVTDPPYGQTNEKYDDDVAFHSGVWRECYRLAGDNAALISFAGSPTYHKIATAIEAGGWRVRQMWAWVYRDGMITSAWPKEGFDRLGPAMTPIVYATKGKVLLRLRREGEPWVVRYDRGNACNYSDRSRGGQPTAAEGHWPRSVVADAPGFEYFTLSYNAINRGGSKHPNEKPLPLMRWLCGKLPPGAVLDPFAGSGTTLLAALAEGHTSAVGVEKNRDYCAVIRKRMADEATRTPLFPEIPG